MVLVRQDHHEAHVALSMFASLGFMPECRLSNEHLDLLSCIVGDTIHNLRCALDLLACEVVELSGGNPRNVHFPFCALRAGLTTKTAFSGDGGEMRRKGFSRARADAQALLLSLEPHGEPGGSKHLWALHKLDLIDKHQDLLALTSRQSRPAIYRDGVRLLPTDHDEFALVFALGAPLEGEEVGLNLRGMASEVEVVIDKFSRLFG